MDPNEALRRWEAGDAQAGRDLREWIRKGGFEPDWSPALRAQFMKRAVAPSRKTKR
jgi:hypothetical protein